MEHLEAVWFGDDTGDVDQDVAPGVVRKVMPHPREARLAPFWPKFDSEGKMLIRALASVPATTTDEAVAIDAEDWAAAVVVFCLWSMLVRSLAEQRDEQHDEQRENES